jgi:NAD dependent epimerase/dehydratase family enzyme
MKAIVWTNYGPPEVRQLKEVPQPIPKDNDVVFDVHGKRLTAMWTPGKRRAMWSSRWQKSPHP